MRECNRQIFKRMMKGIAAAATIAACFFLLKQRLPQTEDLTGMTALTLVCVVGSIAKKQGGTAAEELSADVAVRISDEVTRYER